MLCVFFKGIMRIIDGKVCVLNCNIRRRNCLSISTTLSWWPSFRIGSWLDTPYQCGLFKPIDQVVAWPHRRLSMLLILFLCYCSWCSLCLSTWAMSSSGISKRTRRNGIAWKISHLGWVLLLKDWSIFLRLVDTKEGGDLSRYTPEEVEDYTRGFLVKGLFAYCRHPNYFGELFMWWTIWAFTLSSQYTAFQQSFHVGDLFNYACYSSIIMTLLFPRSSKITEKICLSKYAEYKSYIAKTNMIFPSFSRYVPEKQEWLLTNSDTS